MNSLEPSKGDVVRGILGVASTVIVLALLQEPTVKFFIAKLILFSALSAICIVTAKSKQGVLLGIVAIILVRVVIGVVFGIHRTQH